MPKSRERAKRAGSRYAKYLSSPEWKATRDRIMARADGTCEKCRERPAKQVHHWTYERLGAELETDLIALCFPCHQSEHPDKKIGTNGSGAFFVSDIECEVCGFNEALLTLAGPKKKFNCCKCGTYWTEYRAGGKRHRHEESRKRRGKKVFKNAPKVTCGHCGRSVSGRGSIEKHTRDAHPGLSVKYGNVPERPVTTEDRSGLSKQMNKWAAKIDARHGRGPDVPFRSLYPEARGQ